MGISTDGEICYGIIFEDGYEFPWDIDHEGDPEMWWISEILKLTYNGYGSELLMDRKNFAAGVFLIILAQLFVIYYEGKITAMLEIVAGNQKILYANQVRTIEAINLQDSRAVIDSLSRIDVSALSDDEKKKYIASLDEVIRTSLNRKAILDSANKAIYSCSSSGD